MYFLRKGLRKARISSRHESGDNDEHEHDNIESLDLDFAREFGDSDNLKDLFNEYMVKMLNLIREFAIFCLVFMAYAAITHDPPKVSKVPAAYPFFPKNSLVKDYYKGQVTKAVDKARTLDFSFIMFYAPWDAESQAARKEFLIAADYLKDYIEFTAVNCWHPRSECRTQYSKVYRWPVLIAYPSFGMGIQYNGPISAPQMISFLQKLMRPVRIINETNSNFEEAFVVAELNTLPNSLEYSVYYATALKAVEVDHVGRISFYVKPTKKSQNKIQLYLWNQIRVLDIAAGDWKVDKILQWLIKTSESPSSWVAPTGSKSLLLSDYLQPGPSLILFTPKIPLYSSNDYYMMLQEIAQEYKNCDSWGLNFDIRAKRINYYKEIQWLKNTCHSKTPLSRPPKLKKVTSITASATFQNSTSNIKENIGGKVEFDCSMLDLSAKVCQNVKVECFDVLPHLLKDDGSSKKSFGADVDGSPVTYITSMWKQDTDPKSMQNLRKILSKEKCRAFLAARKLQAPVFEPQEFTKTKKIDISDLSCSNSNQSLNFVAIDSLRFQVFAERLGIDLSKRHDMSAVVIVNEKMESHYLMPGSVTSQNIRAFIRKFSNNTLTRSLDSIIDVPSKNSPSYNFKDTNNSLPTVYIEELHSKNFLNTVLQENKAVLVMYYSKQCSYCNGISYVFLTVARKLSFVDNIKFTRIDGDLNILAWEYNMEEFPTILFFPAIRKEETRVFPSEIPITVPNLLGFILSNVNVSMKLHLMYSICLHSQIQKHQEACLSKVRNETLTVIDKTLRNWRKSEPRQRHLLLHNLRQLRQLQFLFSHSPEDHLVIESYFRKIKTYLNDEPRQNSTAFLVKDEL